MANRPFGPTGVRVFFSASQALPPVGDTAGLDIQAGASGSGLVVFRIEMISSNGIAARLSDAAVLDGSLVTVTPTIVSDPAATLTTVIRTGVESAGLTFGNPDFRFRANENGDILRGHDIFIPPGKFLTILKDTIDEVLDISVGLTEL